MSLVFCNGEKIYKRLNKTYKTHKKGLFILAPSGTGKTHYVNNQKNMDWIDGDDLWISTGAHPKDDWWNQGLEKIFEVDQRSDVITTEAKKLGFWIMGASNYWLIPDAVVLPNWSQHKKYILHREQNSYDGGAKASDFEQVKSHRKAIRSMAKKEKVPIFESIEEAVTFLTKRSKK